MSQAEFVLYLCYCFVWAEQQKEKLEMAISETELAHTAWSAMHHEFGTLVENVSHYMV